MRTVEDVYEEYHVPHIVRAHQLRVAAVGSILADKLPGIQGEHVVLTGLFHDMGNILKMDLSPNAPLVSLIAPDTLEGLQKTQDSFRATFGSNEHAASLAIGRSIGLSDEVLAMIGNMRFSRTEWVLTQAPMEMKVIKYGDLRVSPYGIVPLPERLAEAGARYRNKSFDTGDAYDTELKMRIEGHCFELEKLVCGAAGIDPGSITEKSAEPVVTGLRQFKI